MYKGWRGGNAPPNLRKVYICVPSHAQIHKVELSSVVQGTGIRKSISILGRSVQEMCLLANFPGLNFIPFLNQKRGSFGWFLVGHLDIII